MEDINMIFTELKQALKAIGATVPEKEEQKHI